MANPEHLKLAKKVLKILIFVLIFDYILFPIPSFAASFEEIPEISENSPIIEDESINNTNILNIFPEQHTLPNNKDIEVINSGYYTMTAYNSEAAQTDDSPCITANGFNLCEHNIEDSIAANFLKFGTKVKIPEIYGNKIFVVRDRMNKRYQQRVDIWLKDKNEAIHFGVKIAKLEILE